MTPKNLKQCMLIYRKKTLIYFFRIFEVDVQLGKNKAKKYHKNMFT